MFQIESILQLKEEENIEAIVRRHLITLMPSLFIAMLFIVIPFFLLFPLFGMGVIGILFFGASIITGIILASRALFLWNADVLVITNLRIVDVDQKGILSRRVSEAPFSVIQDVSWKREGIWQTVFRMGSVSIQTAGEAANIEAELVPYPDKLHELINDERLKFVNEPKPAASTEQKDRRSRVRRIAELLEQVDDKSVAEIESVLERKVKNSSMEKLFDKVDQQNSAQDEDKDEDNDEDEGMDDTEEKDELKDESVGSTHHHITDNLPD